MPWRTNMERRVNLTMEQCFIDTNVFLRYLTNDDPQKADRIETLFEKAERGEITLMTSHLVIAELVWTLESYYRIKSAQIESLILAILNTPYMEVAEEELIIQALDTYVEKNIDFIDAYNAYFMREKGLRRIYTYDVKHFQRIDWVEIVEP